MVGARRVIWIMAAMAAASGCASQSPFGDSAFPAAADGGSNPGVLAALNPPAANHGWTASAPSSLGGSPAGPGNWPPAAAGAPPRTGFLSTALGSLGDAFRLEPKVLPAPDPISLASEPGAVGPEMHFHAARLYESQGNVREAIAQYRQVLAMAPQDYRTLVSLARLHDRQGDFPLAESLYRQATSVAADNPLAFNDLGLCYARHGMVQPAIAAIERAVALQPLNPLYRNNLATLLVDSHRTDEAFQHLSAAHGEAVAHYNLGVLLCRRQKRDSARQHLAAAVALDPSFAAARQLLETLQPPADNTQRTVLPAGASWPIPAPAEMQPPSDPSQLPERPCPGSPPVPWPLPPT